MNARRLAAAAVGISLVLAGSASAATKPAPKPKPVCKILVDAPGDANAHDLGSTGDVGPVKSVALPNVPAGPSVDGLDILSADLAADKHHVTGVIRVKKLALTNPEFPTGMTWGIVFTINEIVFQLQGHTNPIGTPHFDGAYVTATGGTLFDGGVTGFFDLKKSEVHITIDKDVLASQADVKTGTKITKIAASAGPDIAVPEPTGKVSPSGATFEDNPWAQDAATTTKSFVVGTPSCVVAGK